MSNVEKFYRYIPLGINDYCTDFAHLEGYLNQKVWLTSLCDFNDPFEGVFKYKPILPVMLEGNPESFVHVFNDCKKGNENLTEDQFRAQLKLEEFNQKVELESGRRLIGEFFANHGALRLTRSASNIPMWAHYGNYHQGYCLEFEFDFSRTSVNDLYYLKEILEGNEILVWECQDFHFIFTKITYGMEPSVIDHVKLDKMQADEMHKIGNNYESVKYIIQNSVGRKFKQWCYEDEYRLFVNANTKFAGLMDMRLYAPFLKITGIILGKKVDTVKRKEIIHLCQQHSINVSEAEYSDEKYEITIQKLEELRPNGTNVKQCAESYV